MSDARTIKLSSINEIISAVISPFNINSPRVLNCENWKSCALHSAMTCFSLASISFSLTAEMQMSWKITKKKQNESQRIESQRNYSKWSYIAPKAMQYAFVLAKKNQLLVLINYYLICRHSGSLGHRFCCLWPIQVLSFWLNKFNDICSMAYSSML